MNSDLPPKPRRKKWLYVLLFLLLGAYLGLTPHGQQLATTLWSLIKPVEGKAPVVKKPEEVTGYLPVTKGDVDIYLEALGTVTPLQTVVVRSRVEGELLKLGFKEGSLVKEGQLLAELDPRPYEAALMQTEGQLARDTALHDNAKRDLERYKNLLKQDAIASQEVDTQAALEAQYAAALISDKGNVDAARLQLSYTKIKSPLTGRVGLRQVDMGNIIRPGDTNGIVTITQENPISVIFSISEIYLPKILEPVRAGKKLEAEAWDRDYKQLIAKGTLRTLDNTVDADSGKFKLRAIFDNADGKLFPNQFVNIRLKVETLKDTSLVRDVSTRRGTIGDFVYVIDSEDKAEVRPVTIGPAKGNQLAILSGLKEGERVAIDGVDRLRNGKQTQPVNRTQPIPESGSDKEK